MAPSRRRLASVQIAEVNGCRMIKPGAHSLDSTAPSLM